MPISVIVRTDTGNDARLSFDGMQPIVIGRGASCDVRLPDSSVSHRHACLRAQGAEFVLVDEGSMNGTFVGGVRIAPRTSRIVRSGDRVRVGRLWIEVRIDQSPVTRDVGMATRDLALAMVSRAMAAMGEDLETKVRVVEGPDQGATLRLSEEGRAYVVGRGPECDLALADADASREHAALCRRGGVVRVRDLGAKNGTWLGGMRVAQEGDTAWRAALVMRIGRTVLALEEPVCDALAHIEGLPDEAVPATETLATPAHDSSPASVREEVHGAPTVAVPATVVEPSRARAARAWSVADLTVMAVAVCVLAVSIAGLVWLLRG